MASQQQQQESKTIPLKVLVDRQSNKVVFVEATQDFVDTLFSFLTLPLATIVRLTNNDQQFLVKIINLFKFLVKILFSFLSLPLAAVVRLLATINNDQQSESSPFLGNIINLYQCVQNITSNDIWSSSVCKQMLLRPRNPCESLLNELFLNIDNTESTSEFFVCDSCYKYTTLQNLNCTCGKPLKRTPLDSEGQGNNVKNGVLRESGPMFLVSDDLKIFPSSMASSVTMLAESGCSHLIQLEEVTYNIGKKEMLNLLKYTLTSHEPLTNTILASSSKIKYNPPNQSASAVRVMPSTSGSRKVDIKVIQRKSQKKIVSTESNGDFVDFIFSILTMSLGSIVKLLGPNSFAGSGCVGNLYKSVENLDPTSVLLNPDVESLLTTYYYGKKEGKKVISKSCQKNVEIPLYLLAPRPVNMSKECDLEFVKRPTLYAVGDDLKVKPVSANFRLSYLRELSLPFDDLEVKDVSIGEAEALRFLGAFLTSKFTLTSGLQDFLNVPKLESNFSKVPKQESTFKGN